MNDLDKALKNGVTHLDTSMRIIVNNYGWLVYYESGVHNMQLCRIDNPIVLQHFFEKGLTNIIFVKLDLGYNMIVVFNDNSKFILDINIKLKTIVSHLETKSGDIIYPTIQKNDIFDMWENVSELINNSDSISTLKSDVVNKIHSYPVTNKLVMPLAKKDAFDLIIQNDKNPSKRRFYIVNRLLPYRLIELMNLNKKQKSLLMSEKISQIILFTGDLKIFGVRINFAETDKFVSVRMDKFNIVECNHVRTYRPFDLKKRNSDYKNLFLCRQDRSLTKDGMIFTNAPIFKYFLTQV